MKANAILRYIVIFICAVLVGLVVTKAVTTSAQTDAFIKETDAFIKEHETKQTRTYKYVGYRDNSNNSDNHSVNRPVHSSEPQSLTIQPTTTEYMGLDPDFFDRINGNSVTPSEFRELGVLYWGMWRFTWYSENVLPGDGLDIPERWSDGDFVRDGDGYICCASEDLEFGTVLETPFGAAKVYDCGCDNGTIDLYVSW